MAKSKKRIKNQSTSERSKSKSTQNSNSTGESYKPEAGSVPPPTRPDVGELTAETDIISAVHPTGSLPFTPVENPFEEEFYRNPPSNSSEVVENVPYYYQDLDDHWQATNAEQNACLETPEGILPSFCQQDENHSSNRLTSPQQVENAVNLDDLPTILPNPICTGTGDSLNGNRCPVLFQSQDAILCCGWWKARSLACSKCMVQPLFISPGPSVDGYGQRNTLGDGKQARCSKNNQRRADETCVRISKIEPGLCSKCSQSTSQDDSSASHGSLGQYTPRPNRNSGSPCDCTGKSEYQCSFAHPAAQAMIRRRHRKSSLQDEDAYLAKLYELMHRPPWNYDTSVPQPPLFVEGIGAAEAKLRALDEIKATKKRLRRSEKHRAHHNRRSERKQESQLKASANSDDDEWSTSQESQSDTDYSKEE